jgi:tetratricopeptide (TPR) repeat protein
MEIVSIIITFAALIATVVFGYLQIMVPFIKKEVRLSQKFPYIEATDIPVKRRRKKKTKRSKWLITISAIAVVIIAIILFRVLLLQVAELPRKPIAVMTFENLTGDESYNYLCKAIPNLLITNLEQSERLSVMTWERMHDLLKQLDKEDLEIIDEETGFELCRLDDVNTIITGSFTKMGDMFVTDIKILDVASKKLLTTTNSKGEGVASILKIQVDKLSKDIAKNVSLFERTTAPTQMQVMEVTTSSMEAYNYFIRGKIEHDRFYYTEAVKFLEKAIEIDSAFASAYYYLGMVHNYLGNFEVSNNAYKKAKMLSNRVTEKERLYIEAEYAQMIEKDFEKWFRILNQIARKYPKEKYVYTLLAYYFSTVKKSSEKAIEHYNKALELDPNYGSALNHLAYQYANRGDYARAIEYLKRYAAVCPGDANPFDSMGDIYLKMGQYDDALAQYKQALFVKPDWNHAMIQIADIYGLREDYAQAMNWYDTLIAKALSTRSRSTGFYNKAFYYQLSGSIDRAQCNLDTARVLSESVADMFGIAVVEFLQAMVYYYQRKCQLSQIHLNDCYDHLPNIPINEIFNDFFLGLMDLKREDLNSAKKQFVTIRSLLAKVDIEYKDWAQFLHDILYAEILLVQDSIEKSIGVSGNTSRYMLETDPSVFFITPHISRDVTARAYKKTGDINEAIIEYEKLTAPDPNKRGRMLINPLWRYELAKLYEEKGLKEKAIAEYEKFLDLWKNADANLPEPHDARKRLAKLKAAD